MSPRAPISSYLIEKANVTQIRKVPKHWDWRQESVGDPLVESVVRVSSSRDLLLGIDWSRAFSKHVTVGQRRRFHMRWPPARSKPAPDRKES